MSKQLSANDYICRMSREKLMQLTEMLDWANFAGRGNMLPSAYQSQDGFYGHVYNAIGEILKYEAGVNFGYGRGPNWGGNATRYIDLMIYVEELLNEPDSRNEHFRG